MKAIILLSIASAIVSGAPYPDKPHKSSGHVPLFGAHSDKRPPVFHGASALQKPCAPGHIRNSDGSCAQPEISRKVMVFAPQQSYEELLPPIVPEPEVNVDVILVKTPEIEDEGPILVPPPEQKTVVYVLSKRPAVQPEIIEVPSNVQEPEVFFVNYEDGENPKLLGGIDLQSALTQASSQTGGIIDGGTNILYGNNQ